MSSQPFQFKLLNQHVANAQHAVRGRLLLESEKITKEIEEAKLNNKPNPYPFDNCVLCNIGNPMEFNQKPLSYIRQITSLVEYPELMKSNLYPKDILEKAKLYLESTGCIGGTGAYSNSRGVPHFRQVIANFLKERDNFDIDIDHIFLTDGASAGIKMVLNVLISYPEDSIMLPKPQYPLYSAAITCLNGSQVYYNLQEERGWTLCVKDLENSYNKAIQEGKNIKAIVVINPGNPTGAILDQKEIEETIRFAYEHKIAIIADEVYQENIYIDKPFVSFRKVLHTLPDEIRKSVQLVSFHSVSKGFYGECGKRGGMFACDNIPDDVLAVFNKMLAMCLCSNVVGQMALSLICDPPKKGEESYEQYIQEKNTILSSFKRKADVLYEIFSSMEGYSLNKPNGSMYIFPRVRLPQKFVDDCNKNNIKPDEEYCIELLRQTGVCTVPGSGFGQEEGTYHFRIAFLPPEDQIFGVGQLIKDFHEKFMNKWR